ncbi:MAG TPA: hypothetical protein VK809_07440 [Bacteroidia bacterium]|jgi:Flp pilus assembly protein TadD|nr:hypothetical protein [Bacteroidia bacterium]
MSSKSLKILSVLAAALALFFIYSHHFNNGYQNDDPLSISDNPAVRSLKNIPAIFTDSRTQSTLPQFQVQYRPLFILSFAIDYYIANGNSPLVMHIHTFIGFVILLLVCFFFNIKLFRHFTDTPFYPALLATSIFALHPLTADVVNYLTARSNIFSTLYGMIFMVTWLYVPFFKKYHLYIIPLFIGCLFKVTAIMFVPLLWLFVIFFEYDTGLNMGAFKALLSSFKKMIPTFIASLLIFTLIIYKSIPTPEIAKIIEHAHPSVRTTFLTQSHVILRYFLLFLMPEYINPYGRQAFITSFHDYHFLIGFLFVMTSFIAIYLLSLRKSTRIISFGLAWFFISLMPTSSVFPFPVSYAEYYTFSSLIGLSFAMSCAIMLIAKRFRQESKLVLPVVIAGCLFFLSTFSYGAYQRVKIWENDKAMMEDILSKDPTDGYTLANLGVYYMERGKIDSARDCFSKSQAFFPDYDLPYLNLGILSTLVNDTAAANVNFTKAVTLYGEHHHQACYYYADFLHTHHHDKEAIALLSMSLQDDPSYTLASDLLKNMNTTRPQPDSDTTEAAILKKPNPSESEYTTLSLLYFNKGEYEKSIDVCQKILLINPNSALAWNNMCAAYNGLKQWDNAIKAGNKALQIKPDFTLAKNNVNFALAQKKK